MRVQKREKFNNIKIITCLMKEGKVSVGFAVRLIGALIGAIGFFLLAFQYPILGTTFIGVGSILIAAGER